MRPCRACQLQHDPLIDCARAKRLAEAKSGLRTGSRINDHKAGNTPVSPVSTSSANVSTRRGDRHKPGYQRDLMRAIRAVKAGLAERYPRA